MIFSLPSHAPPCLAPALPATLALLLAACAGQTAAPTVDHGPWTAAPTADRGPWTVTSTVYRPPSTVTPTVHRHYQYTRPKS